VKIGELGVSGSVDQLENAGLTLAVPPFVFRIRTRYRDVAWALTVAYENFDLADPNCLVDFELELRPVVGLRRFIRPLMNLEIDGYTPFDPLPANQVFPLLEWGMNWCVTSTAHHWVMCHSAVLARGDLAVILPAPPGSGKSTLCAALMLSGWRLLSDEMALIDPVSFLVNPFVRPVSLKNSSIKVISTQYPEAKITQKVHDTIKGTVAHLQPTIDSVNSSFRAAKPRWLIFPKYEDGVSLSLSPVLKAESMVDLAGNTFNMAALGPKAFHVLSNLVEQCDCYRLNYSDLGAAIGVFDTLFKNSESIG